MVVWSVGGEKEMHTNECTRCTISCLKNSLQLFTSEWHKYKTFIFAQIKTDLQDCQVFFNKDSSSTMGFEGAGVHYSHYVYFCSTSYKYVLLLCTTVILQNLIDRSFGFTKRFKTCHLHSGRKPFQNKRPIILTVI